MDPVGIKSAADEIIKDGLPQIKAMANEVLAGVATSIAGIEKTVADTIPIYADGVTQILSTLNRIDSRLDGASLTIQPFTIGGMPVSEITIKLSCPLPK